ncbi:MarR family winged helix-turn-helix transcriptional regulator [Streptomyces hirsutus]|uniref:MarR family winged helix-turn-helix transcriptional regulator n=1 Tax=Streptomyces hirsutus TaxID=35620 RepID=UPI0033D981C7
MTTEPRNLDSTGPVEDFGSSLGVLFRAYQGALGGLAGDLPHGPRGYQVLSTVIHGNQPSQLSLAAHLGIDRSVMTYLIDDLVEAGLVERRPNPADRRQRKIVATELGIRTFTELERRVHDIRSTVLGALAPDERQALCSLVRRAADDIQKNADLPR